MSTVIYSGDPEPEIRRDPAPLRESDLVTIGKPPPGMTETAAGIIVPEDHMATPAGVLVQKRHRYLCKYCGAPFGKKVGCELHESQCRCQARAQWVASAMNGYASALVTNADTKVTPEAVVDSVDRAIKAFESGTERTVWTEMGDPDA